MEFPIVSISDDDSAIRTVALMAAVRGGKEWNMFSVDSYIEDVIKIAIKFEDYIKDK